MEEERVIGRGGREREIEEERIRERGGRGREREKKDGRCVCAPEKPPP